jgi:hypothetical protein
LGSLMLSSAQYWSRVLGLSLVATACVSDPMDEVRAAYTSGDYLSVRDQLLDLESDNSADAHRFQLELGIAHQANLDPKSAIKVLRKARDTLDQKAEGNYTDWAASALLDDRSTAYAGSDYERVLVRAMLAACDLMAGGHDAFAYALQVLDKQQEIIAGFDPGKRRSPKDAYKLVAFGNYLRGIISEQRPRGRSEARREFAKVLELAPWHRDAKANLKRATEGRFCAPGNGVVQILSMVGRAPFRVEVRERATSDAISIAQFIWAADKRGHFVPNQVPVPIPALAFYEENPETVAVFLNGKHIGETAMITDVEETARVEFEAMRPWVLARSVIRRVVKAVVVEAGKEIVSHNVSEKQEREGDAGRMRSWIDIAGVIWTAMEGADLRSWNLLPASFQALRVEVPEGDHEVVLRAMSHGRVVGAEQRVRLKVHVGYNTYVLGLTPTKAGGPPPMSSR